MPTYEYECFMCNVRITCIRSIHEENSPYCCGVAMRQIYGSFAINFKGEGWGGDK